MIHKWMMPLFLILALVLAGCGSAGQTTSDAAVTVLNEDYADAMSIRSQLVLGTLRLQETDRAVSSAQAAELLPLWQAARSLTRSGTGATEETDAVLEQIQAAMMPEQRIRISRSTPGLSRLCGRVRCIRTFNSQNRGAVRSAAWI